ncbi:TPA: hypothetical protein DCQ22_03875 [Candidatus Nomurabacteria bacterium]|nr:hypothetical protein [Candidatus Nomurabacteria bacterium]
MAMFYGKIGYAIEEETAPGVWESVITEKSYRGNIVRNNQRWQPSENLNDDLVLNNQISIIADTFALQNVGTMRYITWAGISWKITNVDIQRPRLLLTIGGVYNANAT